MKPVSMELVVPCNSCTSLHRKPPLHPRVSSPKRSAFSLKCRRTTTSELQSPVSVTSRDGSLSPSIPTHKVTVHDRFRGVVHEFVVPEVRRFTPFVSWENAEETIDLYYDWIRLTNFLLGKRGVAVYSSEELNK